VAERSAGRGFPSGARRSPWPRRDPVERPILSRRAFLGSIGPAAAGLVLSHPPAPSSKQESPPRRSVIGRSQAGRPLEVYRFGQGRTRVFILGGQHGQPEANTGELARLFVSFFTQWPRELPANLSLDIMPVANPDGMADGTREYVSGVDPNRNWRTADWGPDAAGPDGWLRPGLGGPRPFSERETAALAGWLLRQRPALALNYHSAGGFLLADRHGLSGQLAETYAAASGYWWPDPGVNPFSYPITGSMDDWLTAIGIPNLFLELTTYADAEVDRNLAGLRAVLEQLGEIVAV
jgi:hypothetical protein